jgi:uncharacterized membrane protein
VPGLRGKELLGLLIIVTVAVTVIVITRVSGVRLRGFSEGQVGKSQSHARQLAIFILFIHITLPLHCHLLTSCLFYFFSSSFALSNAVFFFVPWRSICESLPLKSRRYTVKG